MIGFGMAYIPVISAQYNIYETQITTVDGQLFSGYVGVLDTIYALMEQMSVRSVDLHASYYVLHLPDQKLNVLADQNITHFESEEIRRMRCVGNLSLSSCYTLTSWNLAKVSRAIGAEWSYVDQINFDGEQYQMVFFGGDRKLSSKEIFTVKPYLEQAIVNCEGDERKSVWIECIDTIQNRFYRLGHMFGVLKCP